MLRSICVVWFAWTLLGAHSVSQAHELPDGFEFLGEARLPRAMDFQGTRVGGLSALTYDPQAGVFHVLSDDKGEHGPLRFYTMGISLEGNRLAPDGVTVDAFTPLMDGQGRKLSAGVHDPEGLALVPAADQDGLLWLTSEGNARAGAPPQILAFARDGSYRQELVLPEEYLPRASDRTRGVRHNAALESLTVSGNSLYTAVENALWQDGPKATVDQGTLVRILKYDLASGDAPQEFFYLTDPVALAPAPPDGFSTNGLVELLALPVEGDTPSRGCAEPLLALERSFSAGYAPGRGTVLRLYRICLDKGNGSRQKPLEKTPFLDLAALGGHLDNIEAMAFGPRLADGRRTLILVSDDNFDDSQGQVTQFLALALPQQP